MLNALKKIREWFEKEDASSELRWDRDNIRFVEEDLHQIRTYRANQGHGWIETPRGWTEKRLFVETNGELGDT